MPSRAGKTTSEAPAGGGNFTVPRTCSICAPSMPREGALTGSARGSTLNETGMSSCPPRRGANVEKPAMQIVSAIASATHHHATFRMATSSEDIDAFPMASLYDKYTSKNNYILLIYD